MGSSRDRALSRSGRLKLLLDTHVFVWWAAGDLKLSQAATAALNDPDNECFLSAIVAWEFQWIQARGRIPFAIPLSEILKTAPVTKIDIPFELHAFSASLPPIHGDPVDRILIAQALLDDMVLVTRDEDVRRYPVRTLW